LEKEAAYPKNIVDSGIIIDMPTKILAVASSFASAGTSFKAPLDIIIIRKIGNTAPKKNEYPLYRLFNNSYFTR